MTDLKIDESAKDAEAKQLLSVPGSLSCFSPTPLLPFTDGLHRGLFTA